MNTAPRQTTLTVSLLVLAAAAFVAGRISGTGVAGAAPADAAAAQRLFELRIYTAAEGKMDAMNARFRDHTLRRFEKHGIRNVGYWTAVDEEHKGRLYYLIAYPDRASREKMLVNGIAKDPEFLKVVAESEKDGKIVTASESVLLTPTDYSMLR